MTRSGRMLALLALLMAIAPVGSAARAGSVALDRAYLVGFWTDDNDCSDFIQFTRDGQFITADGGAGEWTLEGDRLTMTGRDTATVRIVPIDQDTIDVVNEDGSLGHSTRCAAPRAGEAPVRSDVT